MTPQHKHVLFRMIAGFLLGYVVARLQKTIIDRWQMFWFERKFKKALKDPEVWEGLIDEEER
ncbi:MAG TPA: hypothetical protein VFB79_23265 [Candidatus Angelobacter sp.]|nr:hypothetical protein [Candidatus Angelobacter sp.]